MESLSTEIAALRVTIKIKSEALRRATKRYDKLAGQIKNKACGKAKKPITKRPKRSRRYASESPASSSSDDLSDSIDNMRLEEDDEEML